MQRSVIKKQSAEHSVTVATRLYMGKRTICWRKLAVTCSCFWLTKGPSIIWKVCKRLLIMGQHMFKKASLGAIIDKYSIFRFHLHKKISSQNLLNCSHTCRTPQIHSTLNNILGRTSKSEYVRFIIKHTCVRGCLCEQLFWHFV